MDNSIAPAPVSAIAVLVVAMAVVALAVQHRVTPAASRTAPGIGLPSRTGGAQPGRRAPLGPNERIDLATATAADLDRLPGVGPKLAERIVAQRAIGLSTLQDLDGVSGVGPRLLERIAPHVTFGVAQRSNGNPTRNVNPSITRPSSSIPSSTSNVARSSIP